MTTLHKPSERHDEHDAYTELRVANRAVTRIITYGQAVALVGIAAASLFGIVMSLVDMVATHKAGLAELLLLFLYVALLSMVKKAALGTKEVPLHTPVTIAIVAVARYIFVGVDHLEGMFLVAAAGSILLLTCALWIIRLKLPQD